MTHRNPIEAGGVNNMSPPPLADLPPAKETLNTNILINLRSMQVVEEQDASKTTVDSGYARISDRDLRSMHASSCMYVALIDPKKRLVGLAHLEPDEMITPMLNEWTQMTDAKDTLAYLVKGNGLSEEGSYSRFMTATKRALSQMGFTQVFEDFEVPVEGEDSPRGKNSSDITAHPNGTVEVERFRTSLMKDGGIRYTCDRGKRFITNPHLTMQDIEFED